MLAILLAALLTFSPQGGTVYTSDGGRLRGTILDAGPGGVTVQLADGSTRKLDAALVSRIDFADGTSWKPAAAPAAAAPVAAAAAPAAQAAAPAAQAAPAAAPSAQAAVAAPAAVVAAPAVAAAAAPAPAGAPLAAMAIPVEKLDTVHLAKGGRVRCLVVEEGPEGVVTRLVDGSERRYAPGQVSRIDWADGTRSDLAAPPGAPAPAAAPATR